MHTSTILSAVILAVPALSAPLSKFNTRATESWSINTMNVHFMGRDTGIPGNGWPDWAKFDTTLDFKVDFPFSQVSCSASWPEKNLPTSEIPCESENTMFQLSPVPSGDFHEAAFTLSVRRTDVDGASGVRTTYTGGQVITANQPTVDTSYLSCLGGRPLDGIRCSLNGPMSVRKPLVLDAVSRAE
ncbi:hypothetical protein K469DRAFT_720907 [Zopfia rhizophila CBS 207.26]|uniref:Ubiquitin 3 binding protein But2 C-terminal domain-containing protein n=1 Tax=Zopfia rhizophila CBS 207.26 TaxID=1314779 RepID=A0A6A6DDY1_9PEZI|nr:hypothetical protein K469DRAFT_720907 [Zopfia rhizophila CBS 207.26]